MNLRYWLLKSPKMNTDSDPCLLSWKQHQRCLTYNYPENCLETLIKFSKCRKKTLKKFEKVHQTVLNQNEEKNVSYGIEKKTL